MDAGDKVSVWPCTDADRRRSVAPAWSELLVIPAIEGNAVDLLA